MIVSSDTDDLVVRDDHPGLSIRDAVKDVAFGSVAGMVAEVFEYPFDLAKVRLQAQLLTPSQSNITRFQGPLHCLLQTWKDEGVRGLYRGLPAPLVGGMAETAALFLSYSSFQNLIRSVSPPSQRDSPLTIPQLAMAASGAGFVTSFVLTPIELIKCKMQVQMMNFHPLTTTAPGRIPRRPQPLSNSTLPAKGTPHHNHTHPTQPRAPYHQSAVSPALKPPGCIALARTVIETYGVRGLWLGHTGTILRETGGSAAWFVAKEWVARKLIERRIRPHRHTEPIPLQPPSVLPAAGLSNPSAPLPRTHVKPEPLAWESAVSGAVAGAVGALLFYPADTVKSAIQTEGELRAHETRPAQASSRTTSQLTPKRTFLGTLRHMYARHGIRGLYAGCGMTVARAVPSSCIIFVVYDGLVGLFP